MLYPIQLSSGTEIILGISVNLVALILFWAPLVRLRRKFKGKEVVPFRARLYTFIVFVLIFTLFWFSYLAFDSYVWATPGKEWIHEFLNKWTSYFDYVSAIAVPVYIYELVFSKMKSKDHMAKIIVLFLGILLSVGLHVWFTFEIGFKAFVARFA
jgi:hypothetical protein